MHKGALYHRRQCDAMKTIDWLRRVLTAVGWSLVKHHELHVYYATNTATESQVV